MNKGRKNAQIPDLLSDSITSNLSIINGVITQDNESIPQELIKNF